MIEIHPRTLFNIALLGLFIFLLYYLRDIVVIILMSIVVASFVEFGVLTYRRRFRFHRTLSVILIYVLTLIFFGALFYVFVPIFIDQLSQFINFISSYFPASTVLTNFKASAVSISYHASLPEIMAQISQFSTSLGGEFFTTATSVLWSIFKVILIIVISFYLSIQEQGIENFLRIVTPIKESEYIISLWQRTERKIGLWFQGQLLLAAIVGILIYLGLAILGVDYAILIAFVAAILELIPFGMILAVVPALYFAFLTGGVSLSVTVAILYTVVQQLEAHILTPIVVHKVVGISPLVVIVALLIGGALAGIYGIILSIPVAVCLLEYVEDVKKRKFAIES